jgi:hypothetical protein
MNNPMDIEVQNTGVTGTPIEEKTYVISPSGVSANLKCPWQSAHGEWKADPTNMAHGLMINAAILCTNCTLSPFVKWYENSINLFREKKNQISIDALKVGMSNINKFVTALKTDPNNSVYQETKIDLRYDASGKLWISCQPDIMVLHKEPDEQGVIVDVYDAKC